MPEELKKIRILISKNKIKEAIHEVENLVYIKNLNGLKNEVIILKAKHTRIEEKVRNGVISFQNESIERNKIAHHLLQITSKLEDVETAALPPRSATGVGFVMLPLILISILLGIGLISYKKFFEDIPVEKALIFGKVYDFQDNNLPIKNARVEIVDLLGVYSITDDAGTFFFEIEKSESKFYEFQVFHLGYETQSFKIPINLNQNNQQSLEKFLLKRIRD